MNTPSLSEINKISNMNPNLITKHYKLKHMNYFMNIKYQNPKMTQSEISNQLGMSSSTLQRYWNDMNMISPYRNNPKNDKKQQKKTKINDNGYLKRPQMTSNDLKTSSNDKKTKSKNNLKGGFVQEEDIEINEHYLDKIPKNNKTWTLILVIIFSIHTFIWVCCNYVYINGISHAINFFLSNILKWYYTRYKNF